MSVATLDDILRCSDRMVAAARDGRWEELSALEADRQRMLRECAYDAVTSAGVAANIARLLEVNAQIIALSEARRDELMRSFTSNQRQRHAAGAYANPGR